MDSINWPRPKRTASACRLILSCMILTHTYFTHCALSSLLSLSLSLSMRRWWCGETTNETTTNQIGPNIIDNDNCFPFLPSHQNIIIIFRFWVCVYPRAALYPIGFTIPCFSCAPQSQPVSRRQRYSISGRNLFGWINPRKEENLLQSQKWKSTTAWSPKQRIVSPHWRCFCCWIWWRQRLIAWSWPSNWWTMPRTASTRKSRRTRQPCWSSRFGSIARVGIGSVSYGEAYRFVYVVISKIPFRKLHHFRIICGLR